MRAFIQRGLIAVLLLVVVVGGTTAGPVGGCYTLTVDLAAYTNEIFQEAGRSRGSCAAAAVVTVEAQLNKAKSIPANAVKDKNSVMLKTAGTLDPAGYYIFSITDIKSQLEKDGFTVTPWWTKSRNDATLSMYNTLSRGHWVIFASNAAFDPNQLGHFYPMFAGTLVYDSKGNIDEMKSWISAIETFPYQSKGNPKTQNKIPLKTVLDSMIDKKVSSSKTYNLIEVAKK